MNRSSLFWAVVKIQKKKEPVGCKCFIVGSAVERKVEGQVGGGLSPGGQGSRSAGDLPPPEPSPVASVCGCCRPRRHGRASPKWSPWSFSLDVMRNTKSHSASCTFSMELCVHVEPLAWLVCILRHRSGSGHPWTVHFGFDRNQ